MNEIEARVMALPEVEIRAALLQLAAGRPAEVAAVLDRVARAIAAKAER